MSVPNALVLHMATHFSSDRGSFLALSAAGHAGGSRVHHGASVGPGRAPWRALCAFKVARSGKKITGSFSVEPAPRRTMKTPHFQFFALNCHACILFTSLLLFTEYRSSPQKLGSHGTTAALQAFLFVTATNGASECVCVRERACVAS